MQTSKLGPLPLSCTDLNRCNLLFSWAVCLPTQEEDKTTYTGNLILNLEINLILKKYEKEIFATIYLAITVVGVFSRLHSYEVCHNSYRTRNIK